MAGHAKVLEQHIAWENIRRRQLLDRIAIVVHDLIYFIVRGFLQVEVERVHASLDVAVLDDQCATIDTQLRGAGCIELLHQLIGKAAGVKDEVVELLGVGHPASAIPSFHQMVFVLHDLVRDLFWGREAILDDLEHILIGGQREYRHHHTFDARRHNELVLRRADVAGRRPIEVGFSVAEVADRTVDL